MRLAVFLRVIDQINQCSIVTAMSDTMQLSIVAVSTFTGVDNTVKSPAGPP